jgi:PASTA domain
MIVRSPDYPLDVSTRYPESSIKLPLLRASDRISGLVVNPDTGDMTVEVVFQRTSTLFVNTQKILAYCDVMDLAQEAAGTQIAGVDNRVAALDQRIAGLEQNLTETKAEVAALRSSIDSLISFLAVVVPAWINKKEVENGDDMGIARQSAASLDLVVNFEFDRQRPGFGHEDVISIDPPAGTVVAKGSTVTVTLNLLG